MPLALELLSRCRSTAGYNVVFINEQGNAVKSALKQHNDMLKSLRLAFIRL